MRVCIWCAHRTCFHDRTLPLFRFTLFLFRLAPPTPRRLRDIFSLSLTHHTNINAFMSLHTDVQACIISLLRLDHIYIVTKPHVLFACDYPVLNTDSHRFAAFSRSADSCWMWTFKCKGNTGLISNQGKLQGWLEMLWSTRILKKRSKQPH